MTTKKAYTIVEYINNFKVSGKVLKSEKTLRCRLQSGIRPLDVEVYNTARGFILVTDSEPDIKPDYQRKEDCFGESYMVKTDTLS